MFMRQIAAFALALLGWLSLAHAETAPAVRTDHVRTQLMAERTAVAPGASIRLALVQEIIPGWHTYWRNPGDSGLPTEIDWSLPPGWQAGAILWPTPERIEIGPLVNHGYHGRVVLPMVLQVPADAVPGQDVTLSAQARWLVCAEICVPEEAHLTLALPVGSGGTLDPAHAADFTAAEAALPTPSPWPATFSVGAKNLTLQVKGGFDPVRITSIWFAAYDPTLLDHAAVQAWRVQDGGLRVDLPRPTLAEGPVRDAAGVLTITEKLSGGTQRLAVTMTPTVSAAPHPAAAGEEAWWLVLLGAFAGGLILNLMPCVFPVLVLKGLSLAQLGQSAQGQSARGAAGAQGLAYTAGVLTSFAVLGGVLLAARAAGHAVGWGFQLQSPPMVLALAYIVFAAGLGLSGGIGVRIGGLAGAGQTLAGRRGLSGAFFTGALAVLGANPSTAPFIAGALGYAVTQPAVLALPVFLMLGLGLAAPFLLLSLSPALARRLPRPGAWMERLKQGLAFPMYATAAWLVWVLAQQSGADGVLAALLGMLLIAFAAWVHGVSRTASGGVTRAIGVIVALSGLGGAGALLRLPDAAAAPALPSTTGAVQWEPYRAARLKELRAAGRPVLIDATAAWCITCLVNERAALSSVRVAEVLAAHGVVTLKADWTNRDPEVSALLAEHGRAGVPLYLYYPPGGGDARQLPQILTEGLVIAALSGF